MKKLSLLLFAIAGLAPSAFSQCGIVMLVGSPGISIQGPQVNVCSGTVSGVATIAVTPATSSLLDSQSEQFTAIETLPNNSTVNVTATATWASSVTSVATMGSPNGTATCGAAANGTTAITATLPGNIVGTASLSCAPPPSGAAQLPASNLLSWDTTIASNPAPGRNVCIGTLANPGSITCNVTYAAATAANLQTALNSVVCGDKIILQNTVYSGFWNLPNMPSPACTSSNWVYLERDITDTTFPAEGTRVDPCYAGIPQTAMPYYTYPTADTTPNTCARHMPLLLGSGSGGPLGFNPGASTQAVSYLRMLGIEMSRDTSLDIVYSILDTDYLPSTDCAIGTNNVPSNAMACMNDQPTNIICDRCIIHGDTQRQTIIGWKAGGARWIAFLDSFCYDISVTYAGGAGDGHCYGWGTGHGYSNVGFGKYVNDYVAASTMACQYCGSWDEPLSPATGFDGIPHDVLFAQQWFAKNPWWDTQIGYTQHAAVTIEGQTYGPRNDQELFAQPSSLQLQTNQTFEFQTTWRNDSWGGDNRASTTPTLACGGGTCGTITKNGEHTVGTGSMVSQNQITWTYTAPASVPPANVTITFKAAGVDGNLATFGNSRTLTATATVTIVSGTPTHTIGVNPGAPDLSIQPSYATAANPDAYGNVRQFQILFHAVANFSPATISWTVDGVSGGNASVGTIALQTNSGLTGILGMYTAPTTTGNHTVCAVAAEDGTQGCQTFSVSNSAPIVGYDGKPNTSKNTWELKCGSRILLEKSLGETDWGSQGNGGGQPGTPILLQVGNQVNQVNDGNGVNVGYGPQHINDVTLRYVMFAHQGSGFVTVPLGAALGIHRINIHDVLCDDCNYVNWLHGFQKGTRVVQIGGSAGGASKVYSWQSAANPNSDNITYRHITFIGKTTQGVSVTNNAAQFTPINWVLQDSLFAQPSSFPFINANGEANDCDTVSTTNPSLNTESLALVPCVSPYTFNNLGLMDSTATAAQFISGHITFPAATAVGFVNYNGGNGGDYRLCTGVGVPSGSCTGASSYAAGGANQASDGTQMGADVASIQTYVNAVKTGTRTP